MTPLPPFGSEAGQLLRDLAWTRSLAARLVGAQRADDLSQEAWTAALRRGPEAWPPSRAWLAGTVRNLASRTFRSAARRAAREAQASAPEPLPSSDALVARNEEQRRVAALVLELEEPLRSTVLLHFQEDLAPAEIAARQGTRADTVRWRLRRGIEQLRARLAQRDGPEWRAALLPLLVPSPSSLTAPAPVAASGSAPLILGGLLVGWKLIALLAGAALLVPFLFSGDDPPQAVVTALPSEEVGPTRSSNTTEDERVARPATVVATTNGSAPSRQATAIAPPDDPLAPAVLRGLVLDEHDEPLEGVGVRLDYGPEEGETVSGADGRFALALSALHDERLKVLVGDDPYRLQAAIWLQRVPERDHVRPLVPGDNDLGTFRLTPAGVVHGRVVHAEAGPVHKPWVLLGDRDGSAYPGSGGGIWGDEQGRFRLEHVQPGAWSIEAQRFGIRPEEQPLDVHPGTDTRVEIVSRPSPTITGRVETRAGQPLEGATVRGGWGYMWDWGAESDADGRFTLQLANDHPAELALEKDGWAVVDLPRHPVPVGTADLVLTMEPLPQLRVRVVEEDGTPVPRYELTVLHHAGASGDRELEAQCSTEVRRVVDAEDGAVDVHARPGVDALELQIPGGRTTERAIELDDPDASPPTATLRIQRGHTLVGQVLWRDTPVVGATVRLLQIDGFEARPLLFEGVEVPLDEARVESAFESFHSNMRSFGAVHALDPELLGAFFPGQFLRPRARTLTDADGHFRLEGVRPRAGEVLVVAPPESLPAAASFFSGPFVPRAGLAPDLSRVELPDAVPLSGHVVTRHSEVVEGHRVRVWTGRWTNVWTDAEGAFAIPHAPPGELLLSVYPSEEVLAPVHSFALRGRAGQARELTLPLEDLPGAALELTLTLDGAPIVGAEVRLHDVQSAEARSTSLQRTDEEGRTQGHVEAGAPRLLELQWGGGWRRWPTLRVPLTPGPAAFAYDLPAGALELERSAPWPTTGGLQVTWTPDADPDAGSTFLFELHPSGIFGLEGLEALDRESGALRIQQVPAAEGRLDVSYYEGGLGDRRDTGATWTLSRAAVVRDGTGTRVQIE